MELIQYVRRIGKKVPFGGTNGSDKILLNEKAKSLTYRLKRRGHKRKP